MKAYLLKINFAGTCPRVAKLAKELAKEFSSRNKVKCEGVTVFVTFDGECNIDAAEYCRDIMNKAAEKGGFVAGAYLYSGDHYIADWEFRRCKGFVSDTDRIEGNDEFIHRIEMLDLK